MEKIQRNDNSNFVNEPHSLCLKGNISYAVSYVSIRKTVWI